MKDKWNKVTKADRTTYYWMVKEMSSDRGWGNGYVAIPGKHPWANSSQFTYSSDLTYDSSGEPNGIESIPYYE